MKSVNNEMELFKAIMKMIAKQFGDKCEVVLHDWSGGYDKTIVAIENGHVSGREVGAEAIWGLRSCAVSRAEITSTIISLKQS